MRKSLIVALLPLVALSLASCNKENENSKIVQAYLNTASNFTGYSSDYKLLDNGTAVYEISNDFKVERGEVVKTTLSTSTSKLNSNFSIAYPNKFNTENTSYVTIGSTQYATDNYGIVTEKSYTVPEQFLSFTFKDEYLENVTDTDNGFHGSVKSSSLSDFFNGSTFANVRNFTFDVTIENDHFTSFSFTYEDYGDSISLSAEASYTFTYDQVSISYPAN